MTHIVHISDLKLGLDSVEGHSTLTNVTAKEIHQQNLTPPPPQIFFYPWILITIFFKTNFSFINTFCHKKRKRNPTKIKTDGFVISMRTFLFVFDTFYATNFNDELIENVLVLKRVKAPKRRPPSSIFLKENVRYDFLTFFDNYLTEQITK